MLSQNLPHFVFSFNLKSGYFICCIFPLKSHSLVFNKLLTNLFKDNKSLWSHTNQWLALIVADRYLAFQPYVLPRCFLKSSYPYVNLNFEIRSNFNLFSEFRFFKEICTSMPLKFKRFFSLQTGTFIKMKKTSKPTLTLFPGFPRNTKVIKKIWLFFRKEIWRKICGSHK